MIDSEDDPPDFPEDIHSTLAHPHEEVPQSTSEHLKSNFAVKHPEHKLHDQKQTFKDSHGIGRVTIDIYPFYGIGVMHATGVCRHLVPAVTSFTVLLRLSIAFRRTWVHITRVGGHLLTRSTMRSGNICV